MTRPTTPAAIFWGRGAFAKASVNAMAQISNRQLTSKVSVRGDW